MIVIDQISCRLCLETGIGGLKLMNQAQLSFLESFRLVNDAGFVGEGVRVRRVADILNTSLGSGGGFFGRVRV